MSDANIVLLEPMQQGYPVSFIIDSVEKSQPGKKWDILITPFQSMLSPPEFDSLVVKKFSKQEFSIISAQNIDTCELNTNRGATHLGVLFRKPLLNITPINLKSLTSCAWNMSIDKETFTIYSAIWPFYSEINMIQATILQGLKDMESFMSKNTKKPVLALLDLGNVKDSSFDTKTHDPDYSTTLKELKLEIEDKINNKMKLRLVDGNKCYLDPKLDKAALFCLRNQKASVTNIQMVEKAILFRKTGASEDSIPTAVKYQSIQISSNRLV